MNSPLPSAPSSLSQAQFDAALQAADAADATPEERAEMLMEIAMGLQLRPQQARQLHDAVHLYQRALALAPADAALLQARIAARLATALQALPDGGTASLEAARGHLETAIAVLQAQGQPEELAEATLNLGLVLQSLAGLGRARLTDAIAAYQRALRCFSRHQFPQEYAVLHNNLAICFLALPVSDAQGRMREALAVQSFEEVLKVINLVDHPSEYAMVHNNLGNALQCASSGHVLDNQLRALAAYDEALRVRNARDTPLAYANTIANKAHVLRGLEADPAQPAVPDPLAQALALVQEAQALFSHHGEADKAALMAEAGAEITTELAQRPAAPPATMVRPGAPA